MRGNDRVVLFTLLAALLVTPASAGAVPVSVGHSGWSWANPQPQGNTLLAVEFAEGRGYASGEFGTLLRTDDRGQTWTGIPTGITAELRRLRVLDANTFIAGGGCVLRRSDDGGQTFRRLPFVASEQRCPSPLVSFHFPTKDVGYLVLGDGTVSRTANGGSSFAGRTAIPGTAAQRGSSTDVVPTDVFFIGRDTGLATVSAGEIYRTTDAGGSWTQVHTGSQALRSLYFVDATTGYAVGDNNTVLKSNDGGLTWERLRVGGDIPGSDLTSIRCTPAPTSTTCLISTRNGERVLRTNDGGASFQAITPSTQRIFAISFANANDASGVGQLGATVISRDGGQTYDTIGQRITGVFNRLRATTDQLVYATGDNGKLARSVDGGESWSLITVPTSEDLRDASWPTRQVGYALDTAGTPRRTDDEGESWILLDPGTAAAPNALLAVDTETVMLVGPQGVRRTTNGGQTPFEGVEGEALNRAALSDIDRADDGSLVVWGARALFVSTSRGETWTALRRPGGRRLNLSDVEFVSARLGYALTTDGRVWTTRDGGRRWRELVATGNASGLDIAFDSARDGYLLIGSFGGSDFGYVLRTSDGGRSWRPQLIASGPLQRGSLVAPSPGNAYAGRAPSFFFFTRRGGDRDNASELTIAARPRRLRRPRGRVRVTGRLSGASGGEQVMVMQRPAGSAAWQGKRATVSSRGTFTLSFRVRRSGVFVAQWPGDADQNGDGSPVVRVRAG